MKGDNIGIESERHEALQIHADLDVLFDKHSTHQEFIRTVIWCLRSLLNRAIEDEVAKNVLEHGVKRLADVYASSSLWTRSRIIMELHKAHDTCLNLLLVNALRTSYPSASIPVRLLCRRVTGLASESELCLQSYAMAMGSNTNSKLGLAHSDPLKELCRLSLEDVVKVSMSDTHTLFLIRNGDVYGCGVSANFLTGCNCEEIIQKPVRIQFPAEAPRIVDIAAGPHHSVFISPGKIYVCGKNLNYCLGLGDDEGPHALREIELGVTLTEKSTVCTNQYCTVIREDTKIWIAGTVPTATFQTFTLLPDNNAIFSPLSGNVPCRSNCNKLLKMRKGDDKFEGSFALLRSLSQPLFIHSRSCLHIKLHPTAQLNTLKTLR
ncbi:hypothetical protein Y032_0071g612 [Ancylostoma ceylanicum]|uniref:Regulator of condensation n=1 Tax=Ancylostoma ceylanicum TaxID=53326 RepID=A0A016TYC0_9BILA|nr:hypothetical protein Y032_0071g612 [Ancylostoma ceylanicum]